MSQHASAIDTFLSGYITSNRTIGPSGNNYIVLEDLIIVEGVTLTILPGTILKFNANTELRIEKGNLVVGGTVSNPVIFQLNDPGGTSTDTWKGLRFINTITQLDENDQYTSGSLLRNLKIQRAAVALRLSDSTILKAEKITIENGNRNGYGIEILGDSRLVMTESTVKLCGTGISIGNSQRNVIRGCNIIDCNMGIYFTYNSISRYNLITENNITNNMSVGIFISFSNSTIQYNRISNNIVTHNQIGMHLGNGGYNDTGFNLIANNSIQHNTDIGIKLSQSSDTLIGNLIDYNGAGLHLFMAAGNFIKNNIIKENTYEGVSLTEESDNNTFEKNSVNLNNSGISIINSVDSLPSKNNTFLYNNITQNIGETFVIETGPQSGIHYNVFQSYSDTSSFINRYSDTIFATNNYWSTTDTTEINNIIYDKSDYIKYGVVVYKPLIEGPDPMAPISKPKMVIKTLQGNVVHVKWLSNKETDLAGYRVYHVSGQATEVYTVTDTTILLNDIQLSDLIMVTAIDNEADGIRDQFEGHESAYSTAIAGPFAGGMGSVCSGDYFTTATATAIDYESLTWITQGDGTFANNNQLLTQYMPGFVDKEKGYAILQLTMQSNSGLMLQDTMRLSILEFLVIEAGNDTSVNEGVSYTTKDAIADNYSELLWSTSGDGTFSKQDTLVTKYTPGISDIKNGWVKLTLTISSECGVLADNFILTIIQGYDITGTVKKNGVGVDHSIIIAHAVDNNSARAVATTYSDDEGKFFLPGLLEGEYYIYSIPNPEFTESHVPTYYAAKTNWNKAYKLDMDADAFDVDIHLNPLDAVLQQGDGIIKGTFVYEGTPPGDVNIYNRDWFGDSEFEAQSVNETQPAANHVVLLMNQSLTKIVGWALSQEDGSFTFQNLPYGEYKLWGEKAGYENKITSTISLTPENKEVDNIELIVDQKNKRISVKTGSVEFITGSVYPNPARDYIYISAKDYRLNETVKVEIVTAKGSIIRSIMLNNNNDGSFGPIDISKLEKGLYFILITSKSGSTKNIKLTKF